MQKCQYGNQVWRIVVLAGLLVGALPAWAADGQQVYNQNCQSCHGSGLPGVPQRGDNDYWAERLTSGKDILIENAINGLQGYNGIMPPRGGNPALTDDEIADAVGYLLEE